MRDLHTAETTVTCLTSFFFFCFICSSLDPYADTDVTVSVFVLMRLAKGGI